MGEASGIARSNAEVRVFRDKPFEWLRYGPGRERVDELGWTETAQTIHVEGGVQLETESRKQIPQQNIAEALAFLEELGFIHPGPLGQKLFGKSDDVIDVESNHANNSESTP